MASTRFYPIGLTRIILDTLLDLTPEVEASGERWNRELLDKVEREIKEQFAPPRPGRKRVFFDMVFHRSFAEASDLLLAATALTPAQGEAIMGREATG